MIRFLVLISRRGKSHRSAREAQKMDATVLARSFVKSTLLALESAMREARQNKNLRFDRNDDNMMQESY